MRIKPRANITYAALMAGLTGVLATSSAIAGKLEVNEAMCLPVKEAAQIMNAFDGSVETHIDSAALTRIGVTVKFDAPKKVTFIRLYPRLGWASLLQNGRFEASSDGKKWKTIFDMTQWEPFAERQWVMLKLNNPEDYSYYRMIGVKEGNVAEIEFHEGAVPQKTSDMTPMTLAPFSDGKKLAIAPAALTVLRPTYRGMISTARRQPNVRLGYMLNPNKGGVPGLEVKTSVTDSKGKEISTGSFRTSEKAQDFFTIPLATNTPPGTYTATTIITINGKEERVSVPFKIVPVRPKQFFVDQDGVILKDGKPFFPLGIHHAHGWQIDEWLPMGVNMVQMWSWDWNDNCSTNEFLWNTKPTNEVHRAAMMAQKSERIKKLEENDIYIIYEDGAVWNDMINQTYGKFGPPNAWATTPYPFETNVALRARLQAVIDDPASRVGMWYIADEVGGRGWTPKLQRASKYFHDMDEDHPTFNLSAGDHEVASGGDVYAFDCYPRYYGGTGAVTRVSDTTASAWQSIGAFQPIIVVPQAFGQSEKQPTETPEHVRAMSYLAIVRGARGMFWYCWKQTGDWDGKQKQGMGWNKPTADMVKVVISEFKVFDEALLAPDPKFLTSEDGRVLAILAGDDSVGRFLIYVNGDLAKDSDSAIRVDLPRNATLEPLFGGPKASLSAGKVRIKAKALATGAYRVVVKE